MVSILLDYTWREVAVCDVYEKRCNAISSYHFFKHVANDATRSARSVRVELDEAIDCLAELESCTRQLAHTGDLYPDEYEPIYAQIERLLGKLIAIESFRFGND